MHYVTLEVLIYFFIVLWLVQKTDALSLFSGIGRVKTIGICLIVFMAIFGQGLKNNQITYPFSYWGMYSNKYIDNTYLEYNITLDDGTSLHYPFKEITHFSRRAFMRKIANLERAAKQQYSDSTHVLQAKQELNNMLVSLAGIYEQKETGSSIDRFEINIVRVPIHNWVGPESLDRTVIYTLEFNDAK